MSSGRNFARVFRSAEQLIVFRDDVFSDEGGAISCDWGSAHFISQSLCLVAELCLGVEDFPNVDDEEAHGAAHFLCD